MYKAIFYMTAYNAQKYIRKSIESILGQTERNFVFYILDNGSTDETSKIIKEYQNNDKRIIVYRFELNHQPTDIELAQSNELFMKYADTSNMCYAEYLAYIDSDDIYYPDFLEKSYKAAKKSQANMLITGSKFVDEKSGETIGYRYPKNEVMLKNSKLIMDSLQDNQHHFRTLWGKLIDIRFAPIPNNINHYKDNIINGLDTYTILSLLLLKPKVVGIDDILHEYLVRENSHYFSTFDLRRFNAADLLHELWEKVCNLYEVKSDEKTKLLGDIYCSHINSLFDLTIRAKNKTIDEKLIYASTALSSPIYRSLLETPEYYFFIRKNISEFIERLLSPLDKRNKYYYMRYLLVRLGMAFDLEQNKKSDLPLYFSIICDKNNKLKWHLLSVKKHKYIKTIDAIKLCNIESTENNAKINQALEAFDNKDYKKASLIIRELENTAPINKFVLYISMILFSVDRTYSNGVKSAVYSEIFWEGDTDLSPLAAQILETFNSKY